MWNKQIIFILGMLWIGGSMAKSFRPTSFDYDYRADSSNYRANSATTTPRPALQKYWDNFVSNIPTLPPFRWNMTNSLSSLFNNGAQEIIETPVAIDLMMEEKPKRRRKSSKRKLSTKKNKNRKRAQSRHQSSYYSYRIPTYQQNSRYQQMQLQPLGLDETNTMHFYEPKSGNYFAMQMLSKPQNNYNYNRYNNYYNNHEDYSYNPDDDDDNDEAYYQEEGYSEDEYNHGDDYNTENMDFDTEYNRDDEYDVEGVEDDFANDVVLADNWGYTDDEVFDDRKLKGGLNVIKPLTSEMELTESDESESEDDTILSDNDQQTNSKPVTETNQETTVKRLKPTATKETAEEKEEESVRNLLGTFMKDDLSNRRRQSANTKQSSRLVERPRKTGYYIFPADFWLN